MKNERSLQAACIKWAKEQGVWARKVETPSYNGFPDVMCLYNAEVLFIEFKHPNGKGRLHPLQKKDHELLLNVGHVVRVIDSMEEFKFLIESFKGWGI